MNILKFVEEVYEGKIVGKSLCAELKIKESELNQFLKDCQLDKPHILKDLRWEIHGIIEGSLYSANEVDDIYQLCLNVLNNWNEKIPHIQINEEIARRLILLHFKSPIERRAFIELCEGEIEIYKLYMKNDMTLFVRYLIKSQIAFETFNKFKRKPTLIIDTAVFIVEKLFGMENRELVIQVLNKMGVLSKKEDEETGEIEFGLNNQKARFIRKGLHKSDAPYLKGFKIIFENLLKEYETEIHKQKLYSYFESYSEEGRKAIEMRRQIEIERKLKKEKPAQVDAVQVNNDESVFELIDEEKENKPQFQEKTITVSEPEVQVEIEISNQESILNSTEFNELQERFELATEEILRLERELERQKKQAKESELAAITNLFKKLGNSGMNYLLSDLYRVSNNESDMPKEIIQGQLMNFFSALLFEIELAPFGNGYKTGDVFKVDRGELANTYQVLRQIQSNESELVVELIQYGWELKGKKIVQPLVKEKLEVL